MTIITLDSGRIDGRSENGIDVFLGVPYAAPVTPGHRFGAPRDVPPWQGVRPARALGAICPQVATYGPVGRGATSRHEAGEDFLTLNIRSPDLRGQAPVLVWLHGGGYAVGSGNEPILQTGAFAASGIVEVTPNYRLGALGFLSLDGQPENRGLLDVIKALEWVRRHIARFGGDPARVTLAGRSAGGFAVATLLAMPAARGLFSRAMIQSGATPAILPMADARAVTRRFLDRLGADAAALETLPMSRLLEAQRDLCDQCYEHHDPVRDGTVTMVGIPFQPVIDPPTLPMHPEQAAITGRVMPVPVMIGTTSAEYLTHSTAHPHLSLDDTIRLLDPRVRPAGTTGAEIVARYRAALPDHDATGLWRAIAGDLVFQNPTTRYAALLSDWQPVHKYLFGAIGPNETGAAHGDELGCVWWNDATGRATLPERYRNLDPALSRRVHDIWRRFIIGETALCAEGPWPRHARAAPAVLWIRPSGTIVTPDPFGYRPGLWPAEGATYSPTAAPPGWRRSNPPK
ncbi:carboxylesterase/lipase family protein [Gluconacetobacter sacchari]|uniref:Carboxylic ester hydrolase n=2 Tax=Gluconacetobacter sacchari TaxID=92759 RepID=A0A7W4IB85_9PROT|nr:carboxylesterase family protein [Gluconacetobacter sacchari]MBB2159650.1 carboxylesterase/lipase family protein [Gluconacetobacter sacchari]GBQ20717.1 carboxylesterase type B [Gluconacetobacter sacchari DSM 12717]